MIDDNATFDAALSHSQDCFMRYGRLLSRCDTLKDEIHTLNLQQLELQRKLAGLTASLATCEAAASASSTAVLAGPFLQPLADALLRHFPGAETQIFVEVPETRYRVEFVVSGLPPATSLVGRLLLRRDTRTGVLYCCNESCDLEISSATLLRDIAALAATAART